MCSNSRAAGAHHVRRTHHARSAHHVPAGNTSFQKEKPSEWMVFFLVARVETLPHDLRDIFAKSKLCLEVEQLSIPN